MIPVVTRFVVICCLWKNDALWNLYIPVNKDLFTCSCSLNASTGTHYGNVASWDDTPLYTDASIPRGPRTPWSPERTNVHPPGRCQCQSMSIINLYSAES